MTVGKAAGPGLLLLALGSLASLGALGCGVKTVREPVYSEVRTGAVEAYLRRYEEDGKVVARGFDHPVLLSPVRAAHILAFLEIEEGTGEDAERRPAIAGEIIFEVGEALARGLEAAGPDDEVVVQAIRRDRTLGIFTNRHLTSFVAFVRDGRLHVSLGYVDWPVPKFGGGVQGREDLPEPVVGERHMDFRIVPTDAFVTPGPQSAAFDWRDERFRNPERVRLTPTGEVRRRTILLQGTSPPEGSAEAGGEDGAPERRAAEPPRDVIPEGLPPATLRRLADLEEARRKGLITETEYQARRRRLLAQ